MILGVLGGWGEPALDFFSSLLGASVLWGAYCNCKHRHRAVKFQCSALAVAEGPCKPRNTTEHPSKVWDPW